MGVEQSMDVEQSTVSVMIGHGHFRWQVQTFLFRINWT